MSSQNELINDLENIVGEYTDQKDYEKLIEANPKVHTVDKLLLKKAKEIPESFLNKAIEAFKAAKEYQDFVKARNEEYKKEKGKDFETYNINPEKIVIILLQSNSNYPEEKIDDIDYEYIDEQIARIFGAWKDLFFNHAIYEILGSLQAYHPEFADKIKTFLDRVKGEDLFGEAVKIYKLKDKLYYDTDPFDMKIFRSILIELMQK